LYNWLLDWKRIRRKYSKKGPWVTRQSPLRNREKC
jgi:hypothetical protein